MVLCEQDYGDRLLKQSIIFKGGKTLTKQNQKKKMKNSEICKVCKRICHIELEQHLFNLTSWVCNFNLFHSPDANGLSMLIFQKSIWY